MQRFGLDKGRVFCCLGAVFAMALTGCPPDPDIVGLWKVDNGLVKITAGQIRAAAYADTAGGTTGKADIAEEEVWAWLVGNYTLDTSTDPRRIDVDWREYSFVDSAMSDETEEDILAEYDSISDFKEALNDELTDDPDYGKIAKGIYEADGDTLRIAMGGMGEERPADYGNTVPFTRAE